MIEDKECFWLIGDVSENPSLSADVEKEALEPPFSVRGLSGDKKGTTKKGFKFMLKQYKWAKVYRGKNGDLLEKWFVYYSFKNPFTLKFERIKVYEGINEFKDLKQKEAFADELCKEVNLNLKAGYNPFEVEKEGLNELHEIKAEKHLSENPKSPTLLNAFREFLKVKNEKDLSVGTIHAYEGFVSKFENYLFENRLADIRLDNLDTKFIKECLYWLNNIHKWNGTTYNNHLNFWVTLLNWWSKSPRKWINRDDFEIGTDSQLEKKTAKVMRHQYFGETVLNKVKKAMDRFPSLLFYSKFIYYSCMRPEEIRQLKIENIDLNGRYIKIIGKTSSRTVPICDELFEMLKSMQLDKYRSDYYVIGRSSEICNTMHGENYFSRVFREEIKEKLGLSKDFTLYGFKHTRVVNLLNSGYSDAEIMGLTGHRDTSSYDKYKRDLIGNLTNNSLKGKTVDW